MKNKPLFLILRKIKRRNLKEGTLEELRDQILNKEYGKGRMYPNSKVQCFRCDKFGHYARNCPERKNHHASYANEEPPQKKKKLQDSSSDDEFTL